MNIGIGIPGLLGVLFVALKLMGYIAWSWWWVLAPFWLPTVVIIILLVGWLVILLAISVCVSIASAR